MDEKLKIHRRKVIRRILILMVSLAGLIMAIFLYFTYKQYSDYEVLETIEREDTAATHFETYGDGVLKYSNDGAFYQDLDHNMIWNQTYEMEEPTVKICSAYVAIGDIGGSTLYVMDETGMQGKIETTMPIDSFAVASQGTVAMLLRAESSYYLKLYDKAGQELASGQLHEKNSGFPLSMALSWDAKKLAVAMMNLSSGKVGTTLQFYNFGSVGQSEQDNIVASYTYEDMLIPEMTYTSSDLLVAFGDNQILTFSGAQKPVQEGSISLSHEVKSVFYNDNYFGFSYNNEDEQNTRQLEVYDKHCEQVLSESFQMDYEKIELLSNNEICIRSEYACMLYTLFGVQKFSHEFDVPIYQIIPQYAGIYYTFIEEGKTEQVRLM